MSFSQSPGEGIEIYQSDREDSKIATSLAVSFWKNPSVGFLAQGVLALGVRTKSSEIGSTDITSHKPEDAMHQSKTVRMPVAIPIELREWVVARAIPYSRTLNSVVIEALVKLRDAEKEAAKAKKVA
jgi:hypothetical protein